MIFLLTYAAVISCVATFPSLVDPTPSCPLDISKVDNDRIERSLTSTDQNEDDTIRSLYCRLLFEPRRTCLEYTANSQDSRDKNSAFVELQIWISYCVEQKAENGPCPKNLTRLSDVQPGQENSPAISHYQSLNTYCKAFLVDRKSCLENAMKNDLYAGHRQAQTELKMWTSFCQKTITQGLCQVDPNYIRRKSLLAENTIMKYGYCKAHLGERRSCLQQAAKDRISYAQIELDSWTEFCEETVLQGPCPIDVSTFKEAKNESSFEDLKKLYCKITLTNRKSCLEIVAKDKTSPRDDHSWAHAELKMLEYFCGMPPRKPPSCAIDPAYFDEVAQLEVLDDEHIWVLHDEYCRYMLGQMDYCVEKYIGYDELHLDSHHAKTALNMWKTLCE